MDCFGLKFQLWWQKRNYIKSLQVVVPIGPMICCLQIHYFLEFNSRISWNLNSSTWWGLTVVKCGYMHISVRTQRETETERRILDKHVDNNGKLHNYIICQYTFTFSKLNITQLRARLNPADSKRLWSQSYEALTHTSLFVFNSPSSPVWCYYFNTCFQCVKLKIQFIRDRDKRRGLT